MFLPWNSLQDQSLRPWQLGWHLLAVFVLAQFWPTLLPPSSSRKATQCKSMRSKGEVLMHFMFSSQKRIQLTYKLSLPLICNFFKSNLFTNFNLGTSHNNQLSMGTPHNKTNAEQCSTQQSTGSDCVIFFNWKCMSSMIVRILQNNFKYFRYFVII